MSVKVFPGIKVDEELLVLGGVVAAMVGAAVLVSKAPGSKAALDIMNVLRESPPFKTPQSKARWPSDLTTA